MASWKASGEPLRRIQAALTNWNCTCYVHWSERCAEWLARTLDRSRYSQRQVASLMHEFASSGGEVRAQQDATGDYDEDIWYSVVLKLDGKNVFIKFVLRPEREDDPGIVIVSIHGQLR